MRDAISEKLGTSEKLSAHGVFEKYRVRTATQETELRDCTFQNPPPRKFLVAVMAPSNDAASIVLLPRKPEAMVKAGAIPGVVHEPPAGIRLVPLSTAHGQPRQQVEAGLEAPASTRRQPAQSRSTPSGGGGSADGEFAFSLTSPATAMQKNGLENSPAAKERFPPAAEPGLAIGSAWVESPAPPPQDSEARRRSDSGSSGWLEEGQVEQRADDTGGWPMDGEVDNAWSSAEPTRASAGSAETATRVRGKAGGCPEDSGAGDAVKMKQQADWSKVTRQVNALLIEGELSPRELNESYSRLHHRVCVFCFRVRLRLGLLT